MADTDKCEAEQADHADHGVSLSETCLRGEIAFWEDMLESKSAEMPPEAVERMQHALALAENRLSGLHEARRHATVSNIYPLDPARRKYDEQGTGTAEHDREQPRTGTLARTARRGSH